MSTPPESPSPRLLIVGLDGATLDLIRPWAEAGKLPTFKRFFERGVNGPLVASIPPVTAPSWTSFMTGKNPGKHGLFNFIEPQPGDYKPRYTNAHSRLSKTLWQILSEAGLRVGVINVPMTYPPEPINGFMVSGMDAPAGGSDITHPSELHAELAKELGQVDRQIRWLGYVKNDERRESLLNDLRLMDEHYLRMTNYLLDTHPVDVAMMVSTATDTVQHFFYQYVDENHPRYDAEGAKKFGDAILGVYQRLDQAIADFEARMPEGTPIVLMSDHGFRSVSCRVVHLNRHLEDLGLLRRKPERGALVRGVKAAMKKVDTVLRAGLGPGAKAFIDRMFPRLRRAWEVQYGGLGNIDWSATRAYCYEVLAVPSGVWINLKGARPEGIVEAGEEYEEVLDLVSRGLMELKDPVTGEQLIERVYRKEEVYSGAHLDRAPDLVVPWWEGVSFSGKPSTGATAPVIYTGDQPAEAGEWGGTHALEGIVMMKGGALREGLVLTQPNIVDLAPTMLYMLGLPVPDDMDGRVLLEAFDEKFVSQNPVKMRKVHDSDHGPKAKTYSNEESTEVEERLRGLGYIS